MDASRRPALRAGNRSGAGEARRAYRFSEARREQGEVRAADGAVAVRIAGDERVTRLAEVRRETGEVRATDNVVLVDVEVAGVTVAVPVRVALVVGCLRGSIGDGDAATIKEYMEATFKMGN